MTSMLNNQFEISFLGWGSCVELSMVKFEEVDVEKVFIEIDMDKCTISGCEMMQMVEFMEIMAGWSSCGMLK
jgi:hypothetical protein